MYSKRFYLRTILYLRWDTQLTEVQVERKARADIGAAEPDRKICVESGLGTSERTFTIGVSFFQRFQVECWT